MTKILSNLSNQSSDTRKDMEVDDDMKVEIPTRGESTKYLGQMITFQQQDDDRNQKSNEGCLVDVTQVQTGADIEKLPAQTSTPASSTQQ